MDVEIILLLLAVILAAFSCYTASWFNIQKLKSNDLHNLEQKISSSETRVTERLETVAEEINCKLKNMDGKLSDARERLKKVEGDVTWLKRGG